MSDSITPYSRNFNRTSGLEQHKKTTSLTPDTNPVTANLSIDKPTPNAAQVLSRGETPPPNGERLELSSTAQRTFVDPNFDRQKVESIKTAIHQGNYPLDSRRIAENFLALEKMISN